MAEDASTTAKAGAMGLWQSQLMNPTQLLTLGATMYCTVKVALGMLSKHIGQASEDVVAEGVQEEQQVEAKSAELELASN